MADVQTISFDYKEVAEALVKKQGLREGIWQLAFEFGFAAMLAGPNQMELKPTVIIPLSKVVLTKVEKENNLTVDAAKINPE
jgi:hypothetical protein